MERPESQPDDINKVEAQKPITEAVDNEMGTARIVDEVFGVISDDSPNYRDVSGTCNNTHGT